MRRQRAEEFREFDRREARRITIVKHLTAIFLASVFLAASIDAPSAQCDTVVSGVGGRVSPAVKLSLQTGWQPSSSSPGKFDVRASSSAGSNSLELILSGSGAADSVRVNVPLEIRSNVDYELKITLISTEGCPPPIGASIESARASGSLVSTQATEFARSVSPIDLMRCVDPMPALRGPRVSTGGNFTTPGNALLVDLNLSTSPGAADGCAWRVLFHVSLLPSQR